MVQINSIKVITEFVDTESGEVFSEERVLGEDTKKEKKPRASRKTKDDGEEVAMLHILEGKIQLNNKAIELTGYEPEMKIDIQFEKKGKNMIPVMMPESNKGNRLTKSYTISCRGQKRENLLAYGSDFELTKYPGKDDWFVLKGNVEQPEDDIIEVPEIEENEDLDTGIDMDNLDFTFD